MAFLQWRRFNFFDKEVFSAPDGGNALEKIKDVHLSTCSSGRGTIVFGDYEGCLHMLNRSMQIHTFKAYQMRVSHICQPKQSSITVTVGEDEQGINPIIRVWNMEKIDRHGNPSCVRSFSVAQARPSQVTCIAVHENLNYLAVGFDNGSVVLYKGDVTKDRHSKSRQIYEGPHAITCLGFKIASKSTVLFITTQHHILSIHISAKDKDKQTILDQHGCKVKCGVMSDTTQDHQFVIARQDAVYFYQPDGRGACLAFEGEKLSVAWWRGYLLIVSQDNKGITRTTGTESMEMNIVTVYDIQNKLIAYSAPIPQVVDILAEWGSLYVLAADNKLYHLREKDTQTKLDLLFRKNLYQLAINLAQSQQYDEDGIIEIFTQYGDHLYSKGDHDGAIQQYIKTIGKLEASYVIRKFLDSSRIHNLTAYLQALHRASLATEDHTTLLLNCYTKLKDVPRLDDFIMNKDREVDFDVETAIKVCRQAGYFQHALYLAERHAQHHWYLKIQLEDIHDYQQALSYIAKLPFDQAESNMKQYGKVLMTKQPADTTDVLKTLCTDYRPKNATSSDMSDKVLKANAEEFIHIFVNNSTKLTEFLEHMIHVQPGSAPLLYNTLLELYLHDFVHEPALGIKAEKEKKTLDLLQNQNAGYDLDQALLLCQIHNFKPGILYLYEKAKLYQQILCYHMEQGEYAEVINICKRFGTIEPNLWVQALAFFATKEENCKSQIMEVLSHVDKWNLLPPLLVVQTLAHNSTASLAVLKDYIIRRLQQQNDQIDEDNRLILQYQEETERMRHQIEQLKTSAKLFQVTKCSACSHPLELPSVHFLCQHSYHQHCFESYSENDTECPACLPENRKLLDIIRAQEQNKDLHENFHHQLERSQDGFSVVADYFGRGVFNKVTLITDASGRLSS
eukprot:GHVU01040411.1.p1 GENE.GHVU01040411.1~~GHVU01040411.1.p1  ORF type:complete len:904 (-),score=100.20 GHVU01040411.1:521-3232(-)